MFRKLAPWILAVLGGVSAPVGRWLWVQKVDAQEFRSHVESHASERLADSLKQDKRLYADSLWKAAEERRSIEALCHLHGRRDCDQ